MKRQKLIAKLGSKGIHTAKDLPSTELERKAAMADRNPALTGIPFRPLPPISKLVRG